MNDIISFIEELCLKLDRHRKEGLKEYPTRTIFIDPALQALGWDVRDPDEVQLEYPTIDGKSVDYALKINRKPVLFIEAKPLNDSLTDVKSITQVVGYAANAGVEWCILTNGITYKVYRSTEKAEAPDKLLFEISIDSNESKDRPVQQVAEQFNRFSRDAMARGVLDEIGEQVFTTGKVRKALDKIFLSPPANMIKIVRLAIPDKSIKPIQIKEALKRLWTPSSEVEIPSKYPVNEEIGKPELKRRRGKDCGEDHHIKEKPREAIELFRSIDRFCRELDPSTVQRKYLDLYISYRHIKDIFCCIRIQKSGLLVWLKLNYSRLEKPPDCIRDVSNIGHWGVGNVEIRVENLDKLQIVKPFIRQSFEENK